MLLVGSWDKAISDTTYLHLYYITLQSHMDPMLSTWYKIHIFFLFLEITQCKYFEDEKHLSVIHYFDGMEYITFNKISFFFSTTIESKSLVHSKFNKKLQCYAYYVKQLIGCAPIFPISYFIQNASYGLLSISIRTLSTWFLNDKKNNSR
jgi:hypothetical protein